MRKKSMVIRGMIVVKKILSELAEEMDESEFEGEELVFSKTRSVSKKEVTN